MSLISLNNVQKTYDTEVGAFWALKGINLDVEPDEFVARK